MVRRRIALCSIGFACLFLALLARLFYLTVLTGEELERRAQSQWTSESVVEPARGKILDRNGGVIAESAASYIVSVNPRQVTDPKGMAELLASVLDMDADGIFARISDKTRSNVTVSRQVLRHEAQELKVLLAESEDRENGVLSGLKLSEDSTRYYVMGQFAAQLLGLTTVDGVGQSGLEMDYDSYLSGKTGYVVEEIDGKGREVADGETHYVPAVDGSTLQLTLDSSIQSFCETAAREAMSTLSAKAVRVIAMDPDTGEILAMVNKPDYDPNDPPRHDVALLTALMKNRCLTDSYEPGSTFKIFTMAAAIEENLTRLSEGFYCTGSIRVAGGRIGCWKAGGHGAQTLKEALGNSCNPVFVDLGLRIGVERMYEYMERFGFGQRTGIDLSGEASGIVIGRSSVTTGDLARIAFGQSVAVTPLQLITAACSVVNGGRRMQPYIVGRITSPEGEVLYEGAPRVLAETVTEETSATMRSLLEYVVSGGGGGNAYIEGYRVGGKAGTAQIYVDGAVSEDKHIGSFIGFAPMDDPEIAVLFIVEEADVSVDYGSVTAAPFARDILEKSLIYLGVEPVLPDGESPAAEVPSVSGLPLADAMATLRDAVFSWILASSGTTVARQVPAGGAEAAEGSVVLLYMEGADGLSEYTAVPDVTGLTVAEASRLLRSGGLALVAEGGGVAVSQSPPAGEAARTGSSVTVQFSND